MTPVERLRHCLEGAVIASKELKALKEKHYSEQISLPTNADLVRKMHQMEASMFDRHAEVAKWMLEMIEVLHGNN